MALDGKIRLSIIELMCELAPNPRLKDFVPKFCLGNDVCGGFGVFWDR